MSGNLFCEGAKILESKILSVVVNTKIFAAKVISTHDIVI